MNNESSRFRSGEEGRNASQEKTSGQKLEFNSAEELIRHDAAQVEVPSVIASRLKESLGTAASEKTSWWRRIFKSGS
jgi:hypothetical protein